MLTNYKQLDMFGTDYQPRYSPLCSYDTDTGDNGSDMGGGQGDAGTVGNGGGFGGGPDNASTSAGIGSPSMSFDQGTLNNAALGAAQFAGGIATALGNPAAGVVAMGIGASNMSGIAIEGMQMGLSPDPSIAGAQLGGYSSFSAGSDTTTTTGAAGGGGGESSTYYYTPVVANNADGGGGAG